MRRSAAPGPARTLDPVLAAHLLTCPPCREVDAELAGVPVVDAGAPPPRLWAGIVGDLHRPRLLRVPLPHGTWGRAG